VNWSWVATTELVADRRDHARQLVGQRLAAVSYVLIDYSQLDRLDRSTGPWQIVDALELASPTRHSPTFDWADFAVEFATFAARRDPLCRLVTPGAASWSQRVLQWRGPPVRAAAGASTSARSSGRWR
jgi:hypothetical protein